MAHFSSAEGKVALVVLRLLALSLALSALVFPGIAHADDAEQDRAVAQFVREGDRAHLVGRTPDAVAAYKKALALREEPRILGRLGLAYLDGRQPVKAASFLFRALIDISDVPPGERWAIKDAYDRARSAVSRIKIDVSQLGAEVLVDGKPERAKTDANSFYFFITPGHHEFRATLAGYEDAVATIDVHKGETVPISLVLKPIPQPAPPPLEAPAPACVPCKTPEPIKRLEGPWSIGAGVVALSGAISYVPAAGLVVSVDRRVGEVLSFRLDARAAWSPQYVATRPLRGFTYAVLLGACANRAKYFACGMAHLGVIGHTLDTDKPQTWWKWRFGLGATAGIQVPIYPSFLARVALDAQVLLDETSVGGGSYDNLRTLWSGPRVLGGFSLTLVWRPEPKVLP